MSSRGTYRQGFDVGYDLATEHGAFVTRCTRFGLVVPRSPPDDRMTDYGRATAAPCRGFAFCRGRSVPAAEKSRSELGYSGCCGDA